MKLKGPSNWFRNPDHPSLSPILSSLDFYGMWKPNSKFCKAHIVQISLLIVLTTEFIELFTSTDLDRVLKVLSTSILSFTCVLKSNTFVLWQKDWRAIMEFVSAVEKEQERKNLEYINKIKEDYIAYSRKITFCIWGLAYGTGFVIMTFPFIVYLMLDSEEKKVNPKPEIIGTWSPFGKSGIAYFIVTFCQFVMVSNGTGVVATYDTLSAVILMSFFAGQLKILEETCSRLFDGNVSYKELVQRVGECHKHHVNLIKYSELLNSVLSPVLFVYLIICSIMICASAIQLTADGRPTMERFWIAEYIIALVSELFYFCWHSSLVYEASISVNLGVYKSAWWSQDIGMRRNVMLLSGQLRKPIIFTAGPFTHLTVGVFITILKASYSYYTLLSQK